MRLLVKWSRHEEEGGYKPAEKYVGVGFFNTWNTLICGNYPKAQATQMGFVGERVAYLKLSTYSASNLVLSKQEKFYRVPNHKEYFLIFNL